MKILGHQSGLKSIATLFQCLITLYACCIGSAAAQSDTPIDMNASFVSVYDRYERGHIFDGEVEKHWHATVWRGERIHAQFLVWSNVNHEIKDILVTDFTNSRALLSKDHVQVKRIDYVMGDAEARDWDHPFDPRLETVYAADLLNPDVAADLKKREARPFWITIEVPRDLVSGEYQGAVIIEYSNGSDLRLNLTLEVLELQLPPANEWSFHLDFWQFPANVVWYHNQTHPNDPITLWSERHLAVLESFYVHLANSGQKAITTYVKDGAMGADSMVRWIYDKDNDVWSYEYDDFDRFVGRMMEWGIDQQINAMSVVGWNKNEIPYFDSKTGNRGVLEATIGSDKFRDRWQHFLTDFRDHLIEKGWFGICVIYMDEVPNEEMVYIIELIVEHDPRWKIGLAWGHRPTDDLMQHIYDSSGLLGKGNPPLNTGDRVVTFYTSCAMPFPNPYVTRQSSLAEMVWMPWHAAAHGYDGYLRWAYDYWRQLDPLNLQDNAWSAGDFSIVYRSTNDESMKCLSSMRFELLHQGIQDFEKIRILRMYCQQENKTELLKQLDEVLQKFTVNSGLDIGESRPLVEEASEVLYQLSIDVNHQLLAN